MDDHWNRALDPMDIDWDGQGDEDDRREEREREEQELDARTTSATIEFGRLCAALRKMDPAVTEVDSSRIIFFTFGNAEARRLGQALLGNPHVELLVLNLSFLENDVENDGYSDSLLPLLRFLRESRTLRVVYLKDKRMERADGAVLKRFFFSIAESSAIQELHLDEISVRPDGFDTLMRTTKSITELAIDSCDLDMTVASKNLLAEAIGANQTLHSLTIEDSDAVESLHLVEPVLARLNSHPQLRTLELRYGDHGEHPNTSLNLLMAARQNGSLHNILVLDEPSLFGEYVWNRVQCYCERNRRIPLMVANPRLSDKEDGSGMTDQYLFPKLFGAAKQAHRTAPTSLLIGLLALGTVVGPPEVTKYDKVEFPNSAVAS